MAGQHDVAVLGPGVVQKFRRFGIFLSPGTTQAKVKRVTISDNCFSGIQVSGTTDSDIEGNTSVRDASAPVTTPAGTGFSCGGT